ncbi:MAG: hypothetical protein J5509_11100 [Lachnospiraceae bacterium]|nr:hypothetical protein [Lachnospiraceae bacterium]
MSMCEECTYYTYDEDLEEYVCDVDMDEDDYGALMQKGFKDCPYYQNGDEYLVVRHQI